MKIIDLLNKIANGEIDRNSKYQFSRDDYCTINDFFARYIVDEENLNLEIIEEKKIPEKLPLIGNKIVNYPDDKFLERILNLFYEFNNKNRLKINEIIDYLDYLKSKGE